MRAIAALRAEGQSFKNVKDTIHRTSLCVYDVDDILNPIKQVTRQHNIYEIEVYRSEKFAVTALSRPVYILHLLYLNKRL